MLFLLDQDVYEQTFMNETDQGPPRRRCES